MLCKLYNTLQMKGFFMFMCFYFLYLFIYYTLSSGVHVQIVQVCYIGIRVPWGWFAASLAPSSALGISSNVISPISPPPAIPSLPPGPGV